METMVDTSPAEFNQAYYARSTSVQITMGPIMPKTKIRKRAQLNRMSLSSVTKPAINGATKYTANYELGQRSSPRFKTEPTRNTWQLSDAMSRDTVKYLAKKPRSARRNAES